MLGSQAIELIQWHIDRHGDCEIASVMHETADHPKILSKNELGIDLDCDEYGCTVFVFDI